MSKERPLVHARYHHPVRVIEKRSIGAGASGGIVGALAPHTPENWNDKKQFQFDKKQFQFDSLIMARSFWPEVEDASGLPSGYIRSGRLQPIPDARSLELAHQRAAGAQELWHDKAEWVVTDEAQSNWTPPSPTGQWIHDTLSAHIHPRHAVTALAKAFENKGGELVFGPQKSHGTIVHATGYEGLLDLSAKMDQPVGNGVKGQAILLDHDAGNLPQLYADTLHIVPHHDGTVAIGSTSEREFETPDDTDIQLDDIHARAIKTIPALAQARVLERWAGVRPRAKSRAPMLGHHPLHKGHFIANGGFKIGFGMAPKAGQVMADLILEGRDEIPDSFKPAASLR